MIYKHCREVVTQAKDMSKPQSVCAAGIVMRVPLALLMSWSILGVYCARAHLALASRSLQDISWRRWTYRGWVQLDSITDPVPAFLPASRMRAQLNPSSPFAVLDQRQGKGSRQHWLCPLWQHGVWDRLVPFGPGGPLVLE